MKKDGKEKSPREESKTQQKGYFGERKENFENQRTGIESSLSSLISSDSTHFSSPPSYRHAMSTPSASTQSTDPGQIPLPAPAATSFSLDLSQLLTFQCPLPGQHGAPLFNGKEVTRFVRGWERFAEKYRFSAEKMVEELSDYCDIGVSKYVETLIETVKKETEGGLNLLATTPRVAPWSGVRKILLKKFKNEDSDQQRNTVAYLQTLACKKALRKDADEVERYIYAFQEISNNLVALERITAYDQMSCFLQGLPKMISIQLTKDLSLDIDDPGTFMANGGIKAGVKLALALNKTASNVDRLWVAGILTKDSYDARKPVPIVGIPQ